MKSENGKKTMVATGLTGKSGLVFAKLLAEKGAVEEYRIRAAVRPSSKTEALRAALPQAELCVGSLEDEAYLRELTRGAELVFHIAGIGKSVPLVRASLENGVKRLVLVHTTGIYSKYKAAGEHYREIDKEVTELCGKAGAGLTILRPTMIYGTTGDRNVIQFIKMVDKLNPMPVVNHADYLLQPVHAEDLGHAYFAVLSHLNETSGKNYDLSGRDPVKLMDLFRIAADELGVQRRYFSVPFPIAYTGAWGLYLVSLTKIDMREKVQRLCESRAYPHDEAVRDFGYAPMPFEEGLRREVRDYMKLKKK